MFNVTEKVQRSGLSFQITINLITSDNFLQVILRMFVIVSNAFLKTTLNTIARSRALSATFESLSVGQVLKCQFIE